MSIENLWKVFLYFSLPWICLTTKIDGSTEDNYHIETVSQREHGEVRFFCDLVDVAWWKRPDLIATRSGNILRRFRSRMNLERNENQNQSQALRIQRVHSKDTGLYECETLGAIRLFHLNVIVVLSTIEIGAQIVSSDEYSFNKSSIPSKSRVDLRENQFLRLTCVVSRARPAAAIDFSRDVDFRLERNSTIENDDQTFRTIVVVTIRVNRSHDQRSIFCRANQKESLIVESMPILLNVSYSPLCSSNSLIPQALYVGLGRQVNLTCHMFIGNPANINFTWHLPNGAIHFGENYNSTSNFLSFKPKSNEDFGSIICRGENNIGLFDQCQIRIMLGAVPDPIQSCHYTYVNSTLTVNCLAGFHQGDEDFFCYMYKRQDNGSFSEHARLKGNCAFILPDLKPEEHHDFRVFTKNKFGDNFQHSYVIQVGKAKLFQTLTEKSRFYWPFMVFFILGASLLSVSLACWSFRQLRKTICKKRKARANFEGLTFKNPNLNRSTNKKNGKTNKNELKNNGNSSKLPTRPHRSKDDLVASEPSTLFRANRISTSQFQNVQSPNDLINRNSSFLPLINPTCSSMIQRRSSFQAATQLNSFDFSQPTFYFDSNSNEINRNPEKYRTNGNGFIVENRYVPSNSSTNENLLFHHETRDKGIFV